MRTHLTLATMIVGLSLAGCTSDPNAPINQTYPIRKMDNFFDSLSDSPARPRYRNPNYSGQDYTRVPGYAPAYPPYE